MINNNLFFSVSMAGLTEYVDLTASYQFKYKGKSIYKGGGGQNKKETKNRARNVR